jgi:hypothetical protein
VVQAEHAAAGVNHGRHYTLQLPVDRLLSLQKENYRNDLKGKSGSNVNTSSKPRSY